jgi:trk system potassium uptake protein TrkA
MLSPVTKKLARLRGAAFDTYHEHFKTHPPRIDTVINPEIEVVNTIERLMSVPGAVDVNEFAGGKVKFVGVSLDPGSDLDGVRLIDLGQRLGKRRPLIAGMVRDEQVIIPRGKDRLQAGDIVYFIAEESTLMDTLAVFGKTAEPVRRVLIIGGGRLGLRLAERLEEGAVYTKIMEADVSRCAMLAEKLNRAVVLHGDGSDQQLLLEENVQEMDVVVTLTNDEETNILASLLASAWGPAKTITKISRFSYFPLMSAIGLEQVVSPGCRPSTASCSTSAAARCCRPFPSRANRPRSWRPRPWKPPISCRPAPQAHCPAQGVLVVAMIRGDEVIIPSGDSVIFPMTGSSSLPIARPSPAWKKSWPSSWSISDALAHHHQYRGHPGGVRWPAMLLPLGVALYYRDGSVRPPLAGSVAVGHAAFAGIWGVSGAPAANPSRPSAPARAWPSWPWAGPPWALFGALPFYLVRPFPASWTPASNRCPGSPPPGRRC